VFTSAQLYGTQPQTPSYGVATVTQAMGLESDKRGWAALVDPHNPLAWFGVLLLVTVGAAAVSGSARLGRATVSASVGATK
jgi:hypothetical protein